MYIDRYQLSGGSGNPFHRTLPPSNVSHCPDPHVDGSLWAAGDDWFNYACSSNDMMTVDATDNLIWSYYGESNFTVSRIIYHYYVLYSDWWEWDTVYIDQFCVPPNHYHWGSETGAQQCEDENTLNMYSPSTSFYIEYNLTGETNGWDQEWVDTIVSPAQSVKMTITAHHLTNSDDDETLPIALKLQWDRYVYQCTIVLTTSSDTYLCDEESSTLNTTDCSESAFTVEVTQNSTSEIQVDSIIIWDEDQKSYKMDDTICFSESSIVVDFSTVWSDNDIAVYQIDSDAMCFDGTGISRISTECPTPFPTLNPTIITAAPSLDPTTQPTTQPSPIPTRDPTLYPTNVPSASPTFHPIIEANFEHTVLAEFKIDELSISEFTSIVGELGIFTSNLTGMIHSGMNADHVLQYKHILLDISTINGYDANELIEDEDNSAETKLESSFNDGMIFEYLVKCAERYHCSLYIVNEELYNRTVLEQFVTKQLVSYFSNTNANTGTSSVVFTVESLTLIEESRESASSDTSSESSMFVMIVAALLLVSLGALMIVILCFLKRKKVSEKEIRIPHSSVGSISSPEYPESTANTLPSPGSVDSALPEVELTEQYETEGVQVTGATPHMSGVSDGVIQSGSNGIGTNLTPYHHDNAHSQDESLYDDSDASSNGSAVADAAPVSPGNVATPASPATPGGGTLK